MSQVLHSTADHPQAEAPAGLTVADLFERYGPLPLWRIRHNPSFGEASEDDVVRWHDEHKRLFELEDGILVEKTVGAYEAGVAATILILLGGFTREKNLGRSIGADGMARLAPGLVRVPDVSFYSWSRMPPNFQPGLPFFTLAPDLAIEVISPSNTRREMDRKLIDYFTAGVRLVWYVYPVTREIHVYTAADQCTVVGVDGKLDGGDVLPGFSLEVAQIFK